MITVKVSSRAFFVIVYFEHMMQPSWQVQIFTDVSLVPKLAPPPKNGEESGYEALLM